MLQVRQQLGDFIILRLLGKGGMGEIYEAQQLHPPRRVAVKVLAPWLAADDEALQRFWRETEVLARLDHPGVVRIIATGKTPDGVAFYAMHLIPGLSLAELIRRAAESSLPSTVAQPPPHQPAADTPTGGPTRCFQNPPLAEHEPAAVLEEYCNRRYALVARLGAEAARVLAYAHRQGVLHRDVKPSNLMVDQHGHLCLVDFGLTRALVPTADNSRPGCVRGTPWYMSPEQARGEPVDARSDLYSLGVTLYELASCGQGPFTASRSNADAVLAQVRTGQVLPLRELVPNVPPELERVIARAMHSDPACRYASAEELAADLEGNSTPPQAPPLQRKQGPRRLAPAVSALATAIAVLLGVSLLVRATVLNPRASRPTDQAVVPPVVGVVPYPEHFLNRRYKEKLALLNLDMEPVWHARVEGTGPIQPIRQNLRLSLQSFPREPGPTLIALDDDPQRRWFELAVELSQVFDPDHPDSNQLGVFFGYRQDPGRPFFLLRLQEQPAPDAPNGLLTLGIKNPDVVSLDQEQLVTSPVWYPKQGGIRFSLPPRKGGWRYLRLRAVERRLTVFVDDNPVLPTVTQLDLDQLLRANPRTAGMDLRGAVGIWTFKGPGFFRNATIAALPSDEGN